ncbi:MAG: ComEC/Rec2 family competence protein [Treponema sp.]|jgi:competence protein ComEC|nr:ComEC/Rec2 family competence protein [Treponema sp.]
MLNRPRSSPALIAACSAAIGFYGLGALYRSGAIGANALLVLSFIPVAALCVLRVLVSVPFIAKGETPRLLRVLSMYSIAFAAGLAIGLGASTALNTRINFGIPDTSLRAVSGVLLEDPRIISGGRAMAALSLRESSGDGGLRVSTKGEMPLIFPEENSVRLREFGRGTVIFAEGTLRKSKSTNAAANAAPYLFSAESLHIVKPASSIERLRTTIRVNLIQRFNRSSAVDSHTAPWGGDDASWGGLALALLIGIRDNLDSGLALQYRNAGCSYILALSGMHLVVLASIITFILKRPLGLRAAAITGGIIIILYCFIVGPMPSLIRAVLMYLIGVLAVLGALRREPLSLLGMAFLLQIIFSPASGYSLGFILSYLALTGILLIGESLNSLFKGTVPAFLLQSLSASIGAFLATAGASAWFFTVLHPVCILASLVMVPLTTVFMIASLVWLGLDLISPLLSRFASQPLSLLYTLMEKTVSISGAVPGISANPHAAIWLSLGLSLFLVWFEHKRRIARNQLARF